MGFMSEAYSTPSPTSMSSMGNQEGETNVRICLFLCTSEHVLVVCEYMQEACMFCFSNATHSHACILLRIYRASHRTPQALCSGQTPPPPLVEVAVQCPEVAALQMTGTLGKLLWTLCCRACPA
jgi:hypothetical protein